MRELDAIALSDMVDGHSCQEEGHRQLKVWLEEHDWYRWDEQIERDSESGALDFLADEVREDKQNGLLEEL